MKQIKNAIIIFNAQEIIIEHTKYIKLKQCHVMKKKECGISQMLSRVELKLSENLTVRFRTLAIEREKYVTAKIT